MQNPTESEQHVRAFYDALLPGHHRERVFGLQAAHVVYELPEGMPTSGGRFDGIQDVLERFLPSFYGALGATFDAQGYISTGEHVVRVGRLRGKTREGAVPFDVAFVHVWTVQDHMLVRLRFFTDTAALTNALCGARE